MLPKKNRVDKKLFEIIMKTGVTLSGSFFTFKYINTGDIPQYSFVSPKKVSLKAVDRNRLRRRGYSFLRDIPVKMGQGIFFYKKTAKTASVLEIKEDLIFLLKKAKLFK